MHCLPRRLAVLITTVGALGLLGGLAYSQSKTGTGRNKTSMTAKKETYPNWSEHSETPKPKARGVEIKLASGVYKQAQPIPLRGAYLLSLPTVYDMAYNPLSNLQIIVVGRDRPSSFVRTLANGHNMPSESNETRPEESSASRGGYFNIDLHAMGDNSMLLPGRYWVMASLGDYVSNRLTFEVSDK